jgi:hypothetical protein
MENLRALCEQADKLRKAAEDLCRDLGEQLGESQRKQMAHDKPAATPRKRSRKAR